MPSLPIGMIFFNDSECTGSPPSPWFFGSVMTALRGWSAS